MTGPLERTLNRMTSRTFVRHHRSAVAGLAALIVLAGSRIQAQAPPAQSRVVFAQALPPADGNHLEARVVEVTYPPGGASAAHSHPCPVVGVVLEGSVRMQVRGEAEAVYHVGESFYEAPNGVHAVSANASRTESARFLAFFTCDHQTPLSVAVPETGKP